MRKYCQVPVEGNGTHVTSSKQYKHKNENKEKKKAKCPLQNVRNHDVSQQIFLVNCRNQVT